MKIDKSNWKRYTFEEVAWNISERVEPSQTDAEIYVGLEHLDSGSIHIARHGKPTDVKGSKLRVYKGDVIFGKRRAYQRKAAIADFDGICSAHAMVLRAKPEVIISELFPFFLQSDEFMNRAIDISEGSLSPTIKWRVLAQQEFLLPPLKQQGILANFLTSRINLLASMKILRKKIDTLYETYINGLDIEYKSNKINIEGRKKINEKKLSDLVSINANQVKKNTDPKKIFRYIDISCIGQKLLDYSLINSYEYANLPSRAKRIVQNEDILVSLVRPYQQKIVRLKGISSDTLSSTGTAVLRSNNSTMITLAYHQLFSIKFKRYCNSIMTGTNYPSITSKELGNFKVCIFENSKDNKLLASTLDMLESSTLEISRTYSKLQDIGHLISTEVFTS